MKVYIDKSKLGGNGTFAKVPISKGTQIKTLSGEIIDLNELLKRLEEGTESYDDPLQIGEELFIDLDEPSRQINHSCNPNCALRGRSDLFAIKDIQKGEELTYDYSTTVSKNIPRDVWAMKCNCKDKNCRKIVGNVLSIPKETLKKYREIGALQDYILQELNSL